MRGESETKMKHRMRKIEKRNPDHKMYTPQKGLKELVRDAESWASRPGDDPEGDLYIFQLVAALERSEARRKSLLNKLASK